MMPSAMLLDAHVFMMLRAMFSLDIFAYDVLLIWLLLPAATPLLPLAAILRAMALYFVAATARCALFDAATLRFSRSRLLMLPPRR